ncbi:S-acyl fatty acid synthase thioesterase, medium chain [Acomys russatus]|uniref:S-acyl fatty acid synthase thioesterase, medium chain n=1 Tax=Acomys russatus TaxID=60746 RepID=UPI0021E1DCA5|nr:S-acyl fatty acid synthase thioesterase, medium chain [Acomys russatus]
MAFTAYNHRSVLQGEGEKGLDTSVPFFLPIQICALQRGTESDWPIGKGNNKKELARAGGEQTERRAPGSLRSTEKRQSETSQPPVHAVRLAGRETRLQEPFPSDIHQIADEIASALLPIIQDKTFAFFGHSLGSYLAFLTALRLKEKYNLEPLHFFVSSAPAPHSVSRPQIPELNKLSEEQITHYLLNFGGTPKHLIEDQDFLRQCIPLLKADITVVKNFTFDPPSKAPLSRDITCFVGSEDIITDVEGWKDVTSGKIDSYTLAGDHFYLLDPDNEKFIKNYISKCLELSSLDCF